MHAIMEANEISEVEEGLRVKKNDLQKQKQKKTDVQQIQLEVNLTLKQVQIISFFIIRFPRPLRL